MQIEVFRRKGDQLIVGLVVFTLLALSAFWWERHHWFAVGLTGSFAFGGASLAIENASPLRDQVAMLRDDLDLVLDALDDIAE